MADGSGARRGNPQALPYGAIARKTEPFRSDREMRRRPLRVMCGWPPAGKGFIRARGSMVTCGHVSGLVGAAEAAGPDGNRGSRPDQTHGVALPLDPKKVALDPSIDRRCHHASSPSQAFRACRRRPFRPPKWPGNPPGASSGPRRRTPSAATSTTSRPSRCAPSCWPRRRPPPCAPCWQAA